MEKPRVYADFNKGTREHGEQWLFLTQPKTFDDLNRHHLELRVGLRVLFYMTNLDSVGRPVEIEAEGVVRYAIEHGWVAVIDESTVSHNPGSE